MSMPETLRVFSPPFPAAAASYAVRTKLQKAVIYRELQLWQGQAVNVLGHRGCEQLPTLPIALTALLRPPALPQQCR